jgi:hypothetical protein
MRRGYHMIDYVWDPLFIFLEGYIVQKFNDF